MINLSNTQKEWAKNIYDKIIEKESSVIKKSGQKIPYTTENGVFDDMHDKDLYWWSAIRS